MTDIEQLLARLDTLRERYRHAEQDREKALANVKHTLAEVGQVRVDGELLNRSELIARSGLSRRTAYEAFNAAPSEGTLPGTTNEPRPS